jgi:hypothetical protein
MYATATAVSPADLTIQRSVDVSQGTVKRRLPTPRQPIATGRCGTGTCHRHAIRGAGRSGALMETVRCHGVACPEEYPPGEHDQLWVASWNSIARVSFNGEPAANAGADQVVECAASSGTSVKLNGSGSSGPDGDALTSPGPGPGARLRA